MTQAENNLVKPLGFCLLDAAAGLQYDGSRYYDPALGSYIQPSPLVVPVFSPGLNRYGGPAIGKSGLAIAHPANDFASWAGIKAVNIAVGQMLGRYVFEPKLGSAIAWESTVQRTGWAQIKFQAEKRLIPEALSHLAVVSSQRPKLLSLKGVASFFTDRYHLETRLGKVKYAEVEASLDALSKVIAGNLELEFETKMVSKLVARQGAIVADMGFGLLWDVGFQITQNAGNPYLTQGQKIGRVGVAAGGALISGLSGVGVELGLVALGVVSGPAVWIGIGAAVTVDAIWAFSGTPWFYDKMGLNEPIRPLR